MYEFRNLFLLSLFGVAHASPLNIEQIHRRGDQVINWELCEGSNKTLPLECGSLTVPLDYTDKESDRTLDLELRRIPAINGPSKGSILFNFGGPGMSGESSLQANREKLQA